MGHLEESGRTGIHSFCKEAVQPKPFLGNFQSNLSELCSSVIITTLRDGLRYYQKLLYKGLPGG